MLKVFVKKNTIETSIAFPDRRMDCRRYSWTSRKWLNSLHLSSTGISDINVLVDRHIMRFFANPNERCMSLSHAHQKGLEV